MNSATLRRLCGWVTCLAAGAIALLAGTTPLRAIEPGLPAPTVGVPSVPPVPVASGAPLPTVSPVIAPTPVPVPAVSPPVTIPPVGSAPTADPAASPPSRPAEGDHPVDAVTVAIPIVGPIVGAVDDLTDLADPGTDVSTDDADVADGPAAGATARLADPAVTGVSEPTETGTSTLSPSRPSEDLAAGGHSVGQTPHPSHSAGSGAGASSGQAHDVAAGAAGVGPAGSRPGVGDGIDSAAAIEDRQPTGSRSPLENTVAAVGAVAGVGALLVAFELAKLQGGLAAGGSLFTEWLRRQLKEKRMSQRQLAQQSGVDHSTISRLVKGERAPSLGTATKLARGLREIQSDDEGPRYFGNVDQNIVPSLRIEYALRGDDALEESDVRQLMQAYFLLRRGRVHARRAPARGSTAEAKPRATMRQIQERTEHPGDRGEPRSPDDADRRLA